MENGDKIIGKIIKEAGKLIAEVFAIETEDRIYKVGTLIPIPTEDADKGCVAAIANFSPIYDIKGDVVNTEMVLVLENDIIVTVTGIKKIYSRLTTEEEEEDHESLIIPATSFKKGGNNGSSLN